MDRLCKFANEVYQLTMTGLRASAKFFFVTFFVLVLMLMFCCMGLLAFMEKIHEDLTEQTVDSVSEWAESIEDGWIAFKRGGSKCL